MSTEKITINIPYDEWLRLIQNVNSYNELNQKYEKALQDLQDEKVKKRYYFKVGTDSKYEVSVATVNLFNESFDPIENFESMLKKAITKEMELRKEYDSKIDKLSNALYKYYNIPKWIVKLFNFK